MKQMKQATQYVENIYMGLETLRQHKMRSFLTILGVIVGVMVVIVIASILTGMRSNILDLVQQYGTDNIYAFHLSTGVRIGPRDRKEFQRKPLAVADAEAIKRGASAVEDVGYWSINRHMNSTVHYRSETFQNAQIEGTSPNLPRLNNAVVSQGRFLSSFDNLKRRNVCVLGVNIVEALFPREKQIAGREVRIGGNPFTVIGVLQKRKSTFLGDNEEDNVVYMPYRTFEKLSPRDDWLLIVVKARTGQLGRAYDQTEMILRRQRGLKSMMPDDFDLNTYDNIVKQFDAIVGQIGLIAIAISGVGLLVGGIGVMNIMLVSVTERTREIGIRKAMGAKRRDISVQFLFEAMTLTTLGGLLGIAVAVLFSSVIIWFLPALPASIPAWAVATGFFVSVGVGLIFGVWPAVKASRLDPIECLRYE